MGIFQPAILVYQRGTFIQKTAPKPNGNEADFPQKHKNTEAWEFLEVGVPHQAALKIWKVGEDVGASKNRGTPKWMVYNGKPN